MTITANRRRALVLGGGLTLALMLTLLFPGLAPWSSATADTPPEGVCGVHYYALDAPKESPYAFGPAVTATDETTIKAELRERRLCGADLIGDPTLTAAHYAEWSAANLTSHKVEFAGIDAFAARLVADYPLWGSVVAEMEALESASAFSVTDVPAGAPSLYMAPDGAGGVTTNQGVTVGAGTAATFTHPSGAVVKLRIECGFQNVRPEFPGVPPVPPGTPETPPPPPTTPPTTPPPTTPPPPVCPPGTTGTWPNCLDEKIIEQEPASRDNAPEGSGRNEDTGTGTETTPTQTDQPPAAPRVNPPAPAPAPAPAPPIGSTHDPAPAPAPETEAPVAPAPATGSSCAPGITDC